MPTISLTPPTALTVITAGLHATNYSAIQSLLNGGLDNANLAPSANIAFSKMAYPGGTTNFLRADGSFAAPPATPPPTVHTGKAYRSAALTLTTGVETIVSFDAEFHDTGTIWTVGSPTALVAPVDGYYRTTAQVNFDGSGGNKQVRIVHQGANQLCINTNNGTHFNLSADLFMSAGQYVQLWVTQSAGFNVNLLGGGLNWLALSKIN